MIGDERVLDLDRLWLRPDGTLHVALDFAGPPSAAAADGFPGGKGRPRRRELLSPSPMPSRIFPTVEEAEDWIAAEFGNHLG